MTHHTDIEPLAVRPREACLLLSVGMTRLYELIGAGELQTYREGRSRRITMASIRARVVRLASAGNREQPEPRRRCRPRKNANAAVSP